MKQLINYLKGKLLMKILAALFTSTGLILGVIVCAILIVIAAYVGSQGSQNSDLEESDINITTDVEQYREKVIEELNKHGIPEAVNLVLAIIMTESGGLHADVMQSSASKGLPPNSITDPFESIEVGVEYFANGYKYAREHATKNINETALQGYNYGNGYIKWAIERDGGWTAENAIEFARIHSNGKKRANGQYKYGNQEYVQKLFTYLIPNNGENDLVIKPLPGGNAVIEKAISEGSKYIGKSKYVFGGGRNQSDIAKGYFDCSSFVHYAFQQAGLTLGNLSSVTTDTLVNMGKRVSVNEAKRGDLVFFDTYKINGHVGIYLGNGEFLNCQSSGGVKVANMSSGYWKGVFRGVIVRVTE